MMQCVIGMLIGAEINDQFMLMLSVCDILFNEPKNVNLNCVDVSCTTYFNFL